MFEATDSKLLEKADPSAQNTETAEAIVHTTIQGNTSSDRNKLVEPFIEHIKTYIIRRFEFTSKLQRMSVIVKISLEDDLYRMHIKGAPEKIRELCRPDSIPENYSEILSKYTNQGLRVLACASKPLKIQREEISTVERSEIEKDFAFVGFLILENKLKEITPQIIGVLQDALIRSVMVTGDNVLTAISVARKCGIINPTHRVVLGTLQDHPGFPDKKKIGWEDLEFPPENANKSMQLERIDLEDHNEEETEEAIFDTSKNHNIMLQNRLSQNRTSQNRISVKHLHLHLHHQHHQNAVLVDENQDDDLPSLAEQDIGRFSLNVGLLNPENDHELSVAMTGD